MNGAPRFWRSLEELAEHPDLRVRLESEFPGEAQPDRREFLKVMGASFALWGLAGCGEPPLEKIVPYVRPPEHIVPGKPLFYATTLPGPAGPIGVLVESHMGRPTKIEGNPLHPASLGATDAFTQAAILEMYDPDRAQAVYHGREIRTFTAFQADLQGRMETLRAERGRGLHLLTEIVTSPTLGAQIAELLRALPEARWTQFQPIADDGALEASRALHGRFLDRRHRFDLADRVLSLDADFFVDRPGSVRMSRDFFARRAPGPRMNRFYALETSPTLTGASADHRRVVRGHDFLPLVRAFREERPADPWIRAVLEDLRAHRGRSIVISGRHQPAEVHAIAEALNAELGNLGVTVERIEPVAPRPAIVREELESFVADLAAGRVDTLVILGGNPAYTIPPEHDFETLLARVPLTVRVGLRLDETSRFAHWHLPMAHPLESWSDERAFDGTESLVQPLIAPLFQGRTAHEILSLLLGRPGESAYDAVRNALKARRQVEDFEVFWETSLHDGVIAGSRPPALDVRPDLSKIPRTPDRERGGLEVIVRPDPTIWDGRFANNAWLQELPKALTLLTWENAALIAPSLAKQHKLANGDVVRIELPGRDWRIPVWILPGHPPQSITLHLGYGRPQAGDVGTRLGTAVHGRLGQPDPWLFGGAKLTRAGGHVRLASTQSHHLIENRGLIRQVSLEDLDSEDPVVPQVSLYPGFEYKDYAWGMSIDLNACMGCQACVIACQSENSIPTVGKEQVLNAREMHWIRVDRYFEGDEADPVAHHQPVPCMQCENAPCEVVCPVTATAHSPEGLNDMVYNRCVGTRYCSNNCPYKVRRFNFLQYTDTTSPTLKLMRNPDVTVRNLGVMEKCTYCVQRINQARIDAKKEGRPIRDGEVVTACQQVCPSKAITFGDINTKGSRIRAAKEDRRSYVLLEELNTRPRTSYQKRVWNRNPALKPGPSNG